MGEKLLDDLARALAEPVPRSRALRLIGSVLAVAAVPGAAFAGGNRPVRSERPLRRRLCSKAERAAGARDCCLTFECRAENGGSHECCVGTTCCGDTCCSGKTKWCDPTDKCNKCPKPLKRCGRKCCPTKATCCRRSADDLPEGWPKSERDVCCYPPSECDDGVCGCPNGNPVCGKVCCKKNELCSACIASELDSGTAYLGKVKCCPKKKKCCGSTCIDKKLRCCDGKPCPASKPYCSDAPHTCCAEEQFAVQDDGSGVCCPDGTVATPDGTCA
jgi:hypothetical protein